MWQDRIVVDPAILVGKPVIKGTRLAVEFLLNLMAEGRPVAPGDQVSAVRGLTKALVPTLAVPGPTFGVSS